jgi:hypothetical protein
MSDGAAQFSPEWFEAQFAEMRTRMADHPSRETILTRMGFRDYDEYRESPLWRKIRRRVLKRDLKLCVRCRGPATEVHHRNYLEPVLRGDDDASLVAVCRICHEAIERDPEGRRRSDVEKEAVLHDEHAQGDREARELWVSDEETRDSEYAEQTGYMCDWCGGNARDPGSINRVLRIPRGDGLERALLCFGCYETITVNGHGRRRTHEEQGALLSSPAELWYTRPDVGPYGHANAPQNWNRMNVRRREAWTAERDYKAALIKDPTLAASDPSAHSLLKEAYERTCQHGKAKRLPIVRRIIRGPDPVPGSSR